MAHPPMQIDRNQTLAVSGPAIDTKLGNGFAKETSHRMPPSYSSTQHPGVHTRTHIAYHAHRQGTDKSNSYHYNRTSLVQQPLLHRGRSSGKRRTSHVSQMPSFAHDDHRR